MDNFFTSIPLAEKLLAERTYVVGTIRPKRYAIPNDFVDDEASSCIYHKNLSLTKFQTKKEKKIFLLSTKHSPLMECDPENGQPKVLQDYNLAKGGVGAFDHLLNCYTTKQISNRWLMRIFYWTLDAAAYNAFILFTKKNDNFTNNSLGRALFLSDLACELMKPLQERRASSNHWYAVSCGQFLDCAKKMQDKFSGSWRPDAPECRRAARPSGSVKRVRCALCPSKLDRKTKTYCIKCKKPVCTKHCTNTIVCTLCKK
uniref:PiggyBac transposable element-derived protein domain-containing protein n=1 Tax=Romanomermis culicivorax TaxID=13658 RepID=A0A915JPJ2_ROMCU